MPTISVQSAVAKQMSDKTSVKADFADRLKAAIQRKGWSMSETARQAASFLGDKEKFGRAHVWHYVQGRAVPQFKYLEALSLALEVSPAELMPADLLAERVGPLDNIETTNPDEQSVDRRPLSHEKSSEPESGLVHVRDYGDGTALLEVSQRVSWDNALAILQILKAAPPR
jgi:transcriptional regulator with XRE-family HTH domain